MSLKARLVLSFSMILSLTVVLGVLLIGSFEVFKNRYMTYNRQRQIYDMVAELSILYEKQRRAFDSFMIGTTSAKEEFNRWETEIDKIFARWRFAAATELEKQEVGKIEYRLKSWRSSLTQVFRLVDKGRKLEAVGVVESVVWPVQEKIQKEMRALFLKKKVDSDREWETAKKVARKITLFSILLLAAVTLIGIGFSILLYQTMTRSLTKFREGTKMISQGKWDVKLNLTEPAELAELARAFEDMARSIAELQTQLVQMDRMSAVGTLAGGVAHEINNPLTGVLGQAQLLLEKMGPDDPNRKNVEKIERAAQRCRKIVRGLLDFSRPKEYKFESLTVQDVIAAAFTLCETEMQVKGIDVVWEQDPNIPQIHGSTHHLQQVFLNILTNAMQAMPEGGNLSIIIERALLPQDQVQLDHGNSSLDFVQCSFKDTGLGIAPEHLSKLFDPFFTTKDPGKGTGLGLSISYGIIQQHRGQIYATSAGPGQGATFVIRLPVNGV